MTDDEYETWLEGLNLEEAKDERARVQARMDQIEAEAEEYAHLVLAEAEVTAELLTLLTEEEGLTLPEAHAYIEKRSKRDADAG